MSDLIRLYVYFAALKEKMDATEADIKAQMNKVPYPIYYCKNLNFSGTQSVSAFTL